MLNNLFLEAGEKTTVMGGRFNVVGKCHFGCTVRVMTMWGSEIERFSGVRQGFKFGNPTGKSCRIEVENGAFAQDVQIYSGEMDVDLSAPQFNNECRVRGYIAGVPARYTVIGIRNLTKSTVICNSVTSSTTETVRIGFNNNNFCTETVFDTFNLNNEIISDKFQGFTGDVASTSDALPIYLHNLRMGGYYYYETLHTFPILPNFTLVFVRTSAGGDLQINSLIKYKE